MLDFTAHAYKIECLSNLHVGSGDNDYGVIDKQIQRDSITMAPVIHASGLKGALREYYEKSVKLDKVKLETIFGSGKNERNLLKQGAFRFMDANLLSIPVRGTGNEPFYRATASNIISGFNKIASSFGQNFQIDLPVPEFENSDAKTEFGDLHLSGNIPQIGDRVIRITDAVLNEVLQHLPIIARNCLENGQSENLWYEEVVPRESIFYFFVAVPDKLDNDVDFEKDFNSYLHSKTIQLGANATVGYGYCKITKFS